MSEARWSDLTARIGSAAVLTVVAGTEVWLGGLWFESFIAIAGGLMTWELVRMIAPDKRGLAVQMAVLSGVSIALAYHLPALYRLPVLIAPALVGAGQVGRMKGLYLVFAAWIALGALGFLWLRETVGLVWMLWLILVVVATDVAGYFVGKSIGGPKFWPRVSPKKTWSGILGGWAAAAGVGVLFAWNTPAGAALVLLSVIASMASQAGDIAESALKRHAGVKDSSNLIPGHGGFLDRFDGMMGAVVFVLLASLFYAPGAM